MKFTSAAVLVAFAAFGTLSVVVVNADDQQRSLRSSSSRRVAADTAGSDEPEQRRFPPGFNPVPLPTPPSPAPPVDDVTEPVDIDVDIVDDVDIDIDDVDVVDVFLPDPTTDAPVAAPLAAPTDAPVVATTAAPTDAPVVPVPAKVCTVVQGTTPYQDQEYVVVQYNGTILNLDLESTAVQLAIDDAYVNAYRAVSSCTQPGASCEM